MAVSYVSDTDKINVTSGNDSFTSFAVSGSNPAIIIVAASYNNNGISSVSVSAGLTAGTPYSVKQQKNGTTTFDIWAIPAPSGTGTITVSYATSANHQCCAVLLNGADQTSPAVIADTVSTTGSTSPLTVTPTNLTANDMVIYGGAQSATGDAPHAATGTEIFFGNSTSVNMAAGYRAGTGSVSVTWGITASTEVVVATRIQPPSSSGVTVTPSLFTGTFSNFSASISGAANVSPSLFTSQFSNFAPLIIIQTTPSLITAAFSNFAPTISGDANISPTLISAAFSNFTPTIVADANVSPSLITAAFSAFNATVLNDTIVQPGMFTGNFSTFSPSITADAAVAPSLITANFSNFSPSVVFDTIVQPNMFVGNFDVFAPAIQTGALIPIADLTSATFAAMSPNINPSSVAKNSSVRVWLALGIK